MAHPAPGIVAWTTSIRTSMAKDPCRQLFEDQVQTHGFIFLDDYLENILAGPKQDHYRPRQDTCSKEDHIQADQSSHFSSCQGAKLHSFVSRGGGYQQRGPATCQ
ncbi:hypothetical protein BD769DRAFT_370602 [Suillus cothurnatus]|nr:hypothetical protein BD769DRAFT_370602 [Suillus cothurnatus]